MPSRILRLWNPDVAAWEEVGDSRLTTHLAASDPHTGYVLESLLDAKGDLVAASADNTPGRLAVGTNGQVLTADSAVALGVKWATPSAGGSLATDPLADAKGDLFAASGDNAVGRLALGTTGQVLTADSTQSLGVKWATPTSSGGGMTNPMTATGDLIVGAGGAGTNVAISSNPSLVFSRASAWQTGSAVEVFDQNDATGSAAPSQFAYAGDLWVRVDFGASSIPAIQGIRFYAALSAFKVQSSPDASTWTDRTTAAGIGPGDSGVLAPTGGTITARYWQIVNTVSSAAGAWEVRTLELLAGTPGTPARLGVGTNNQVLTADSTQANGVKWATPFSQTTADARYLQLTGGTVTGNLVLDNPSGAYAFRITGGTVQRMHLYGAGTERVLAISHSDLNSRWRIGTDYQGESGSNSGSDLRVGRYDDSGALLSTVLEITRATGTMTLRPGSGQPALVAGGAGYGALTVGQGGATNVRLSAAAAASLELHGPGGYVVPATNNATSLGATFALWTQVCATAGTINTSSASAKTGITPLDPQVALDAVRATTPCTFDYLPPDRPPEWYDLPLDPEEAATLLHQRLTAGPQEAAARHQAGVVLDDPAHPCDPLFQTGEGQTAASNTAGVLLAAVQALDARITALEAISSQGV